MSEQTNGKLITVRLLDGGTEDVRVLPLKLSQYDAMTAVGENPGKLVELACAKPPGWSDIITPGSAMDIVDANAEVNRDFFRWLAYKGALNGLQRPQAAARPS